MSTEQAAAAATTDDTQPPAGQQQTQEAAAAAEQDDAAKLWAEFADDGAEKQPENATGENNSHEFIESQSQADKDASAGDQDKTAKPSAPPPANDIWANASPELRAAHEAEVAALRKNANDAKAHAGRMRKQFEELKASAGRAADQPGSKIGDTLEQSLADYPEIARPVKDALSPIEKKLERLDQFEAQQRSAQQEEVYSHIRSQQEILEAAHPGWNEKYINGPMGKAFAGWIEDQPKRLRDIVFVTNHDHIFDAKGAIEVFDAFKESLAGTDPTPADNGQNQELSAKRAAQLDGSRSPRTPGGAPRVSGIPREGDPQSIWKAFPDDNADERLQRRR